MANAPTGHPHYHTAQIRSRRALSVAKLGRLVDELVKRGEHIVGKLDLGNGFQPFRRSTNGKPNDPLLCQRRIEDSIRPEFRLEVDRAAEDAAKSDILSEQDDVIGL